MPTLDAAPRQRSRTCAATPTTAPTFRLRQWLPYQCSVVANHVSACLESMYGNRYGLSVAGWRVMAVLADHAPLSAKEVAERTAMDPVQVTRAINHMASLGAISRRVDKADRRRVVLNLSKKGRSVYEDVIPLAWGIERALLAEFSAEECRLLHALSNRLFDAAERLLPPGVDWRQFVQE